MPLKKFRELEKNLNKKYFERKDEIRGLLVALLSKQHVLLLGAPGTGKSALVHEVCQSIGGKYFKKLVSRTTTPEELFGPVSLKALENDSYRRITTGKLPEADIAFIDEIFKCNSAVLNGMLGILNEREFENDGQIIKCPLQFCVGASNELPEDREELNALWDRFMLRYVVRYIRDPRNFESLIVGNAVESSIQIDTNDLLQARAVIETVSITKLIPAIIELKEKLSGEMNIINSDRRWKQALTLIKANAWLEGRREATEEDLEILVHVMWQDPSQITQVKQMIMGLANPLDKEALELYDQAMEIYQGFNSTPEDKKAAACIEAVAKFKKIAKKLEGLQKQAKDMGKNDSRIMDTLSKVLAWNKEIVEQHLLIGLGGKE